MEPLRFTEEQKKIYRENCTPSNATDAHVAYFFLECERRGLIPGVHVILQIRTVEEFRKEFQRKVPIDKPVLVTTITALRLIAERSKQFRGYGRTVFYYRTSEQPGEEFLEKMIPLGKIPHAVSIELYRENWQHPVLGIARYDACVQLKSDKTPTSMWFKRGEEQLAKCAEADGLRKVAPEECGGLYIEEEMGREELEQDSVPTQTVQPPAPTVAPAVNQAPTTDLTKLNPEQQREVFLDGFSKTGKVDLPLETPQAAPQPTPKTEPGPPSKPPLPSVPRPAAPRPPVPPPMPPRQPVKQAEPRETHKELEEFADRVARDPDPKPTEANVHGLDVSDKDLPDFNGKAQAAAILAPAPVSPEDKPATEAEYKEFVSNRGAKIARDILEGKGKLKNAGVMLKDYLLKKSGKAKLNKISAAKFEELLSVLESRTPEEAVAIVKGA